MTLEKIIYANQMQDVIDQCKSNRCGSELRESRQRENIPYEDVQKSTENILVVTTDSDFAAELQKSHIAVAFDETHGGRNFSCPYVVLEPEQLAFRDFERMYQRQKGIPWTILTTKRCVVREFVMEDMEALIELYAQPGVTGFIQELHPYEEEIAYQEDYICYMYGILEYGMWLVVDQETGKVIGRAGIETNERCGDGEAELGYVIHPAYQNRGIATEVCEAILEYAREELGLQHIFARASYDNLSSLAVLKKLGVENRFKPEHERL